MKPYLIWIQYNGYYKTIVINHIDEKSALYTAYQRHKDALYCTVIRE